LDLVPGVDLQHEIEQRRKRGDQSELKTILSRYLPKRLAERLMEQLDGDLSALHHWSVTPAGTEGYAKAEVTAGGVDTNELSSKTMEARHLPGLFFIGEAVDVTGHLGGFNFQWAWSSGYAAGQAL
jgi:predicted flavoprotein YhiN